jgi:hypothetical protein
MPNWSFIYYDNLKTWMSFKSILVEREDMIFYFLLVGVSRCVMNKESIVAVKHVNETEEQTFEPGKTS